MGEGGCADLPNHAFVGTLKSVDQGRDRFDLGHFGRANTTMYLDLDRTV